MCQYNQEAHGGVVGDDRGMDDYGMEVVSSLRRTLDRQLDEAWRITRVEDRRDKLEVTFNVGQTVIKEKVNILNMQGKGEYYKRKNVRVEFSFKTCSYTEQLCLSLLKTFDFVWNYEYNYEYVVT